MAVNVESGVEKERRIHADVATVWEHVSDIATLGELIPGVDAIEPDGDHWRWRIAEQQALGYSFSPKFSTDFDADEDTHVVHFRQLNGSGGGAIRLTGDGDGTNVHVGLSLSMELGIPKLLRGAARSLLHDRLSDMVGGFLEALDERVRA